jgi:hypothetical protein
MTFDFDPSLKSSMRDLFDPRHSPWGAVRFPPDGKGKPLKASRTYMGIALCEADNDTWHKLLSDAGHMTRPGDPAYDRIAEALIEVLPDDASKLFQDEYQGVATMSVASGEAAWVPSTLMTCLVDNEDGTADHIVVYLGCVSLPPSPPP